MSNKHNKLSECHPQLLHEINLANSVPADFSFDVKQFFKDKPPIEESKRLFREIINKLPSEFLKVNLWAKAIIEKETVPATDDLKTSDVKHLRENYERLLKNLTPEYLYWVELYIKPHPKRHIYPATELDEAIHRAHYARNDLVQLIKWSGTYANGLDDPDMLVDPKREFLYFEMVDGVLKVIVERTVIKLAIDLKIDTRRIRICQICDRFFWKKQTNSETCGRKSCADRWGNIKRTERDTQKAKDDEVKEFNRRAWNTMDFSKKDNE